MGSRRKEQVLGSAKFYLTIILIGTLLQAWAVDKLGRQKVGLLQYLGIAKCVAAW